MLNHAFRRYVSRGSANSVIKNSSQIQENRKPVNYMNYLLHVGLASYAFGLAYGMKREELGYPIERAYNKVHKAIKARIE